MADSNHEITIKLISRGKGSAYYVTCACGNYGGTLNTKVDAERSAARHLAGRGFEGRGVEPTLIPLMAHIDSRSLGDGVHEISARTQRVDRAATHDVNTMVARRIGTVTNRAQGSMGYFSWSWEAPDQHLKSAVNFETREQAATALLVAVLLGTVEDAQKNGKIEVQY